MKKKNIYDSFLGFLTKKGNKVLARKLLYISFFKASRTTKLPMHFLIFKVFSHLNSALEAKRIRYRRSSHIVPFPVNEKRRIYLGIKWLLEAVKEDKRRQPFSDKLSFELVSVAKNMQCKSLQKKQTNDTLAAANKSNIHFRW